jgi:hypothetical protein
MSFFYLSTRKEEVRGIVQHYFCGLRFTFQWTLFNSKYNPILLLNNCHLDQRSPIIVIV